MNTDMPAVIHIVDDDDSMRAALVRLLSAAGYEARSYASAGDFLVNAGDAPTGCLLLDLHIGLDRVPANRSAVIVLVASLALTAIVGVQLW
jgi:FixJ family two-component response regulator